MVKQRDDSYKPDLNTYITNFQQKAAIASLEAKKHDNILIGYFINGIPTPLMRRIYSMDTIPTDIDAWYVQVLKFQIQWEHTNEIANWGQKSSNFGGKPTTSNSSPHYVLPPTHDPNAMEVDAIKIGKLTSKKQTCCQKGGRCYNCREKGHLSNQCPHFSGPSKKVQQVHKPANTETKDKASLIELEDEKDQATVRNSVLKSGSVWFFDLKMRQPDPNRT